jgi:hypothetical protein
MSDKPIHVDLEQLAELIKELDLGDVKRNARLEARWWHFVRWWDSRVAERQVEISKGCEL